MVWFLSSDDYLLTLQASNSLGYPKELELLVGKQMLFKVEITDWNLVHNWQNYGVKRTSDDADLIKMFIEKHNIKVVIFYRTLLRKLN